VEYEGLSTSYDIDAFTDQTCFTGGQLSWVLKQELK
jgi:hypothetical protein